MAACEKCWADAGGSVEAYHRLLESREDHPCTPKEQAGMFWDEARQRDRRFDDALNQALSEWTDKELADKCVALGVLTTYHDTAFYRFPDGSVDDANNAVRAWDVAGALLERAVEDQYMPTLQKLDCGMCCQIDPDDGRGTIWPESYSLPRAIIEACVTALDTSGE